MSADAHTQMMNQINALGREVRELKKENKKLKEQIKSYWEVDDECGGVSGKFPDIASHLRECYADKERMRKRYVQRNKEANELQKKIDDMESEVLDAQDSYALQKQTEQVYYHGEPLKCIEDGEPITISDVFPNKFIKELQKENMELSKKSNAKSDIIRNMFDFITEDLEEVQEGFTIKRDWGNKYIDEWNKIVTDEFKEVVKDINENLDDEMEWKTDGYEFSLHIREESDSEDEEEVEVVQDLNGKKLRVPSEEELKVLGVSKEDFIMIMKKSVYDKSDYA